MAKKLKTSLLLSLEAKRLLGQTAQRLGISQGAALELAIRQFASGATANKSTAPARQTQRKET